MPAAPMSGRRAQAARNDELIMNAARETFVAFARSVVAADTHAMTISLAGTFTTTPELMELAQRCDERVRAVIEQAHTAGVLRADVTHTDFGLLFEQLSTVRRGS